MVYRQAFPLTAGLPLRLRQRLGLDQSYISRPDVDSPFVDELDAVNRLLPYHVFQQPKADTQAIVSAKGKGKAWSFSSMDNESKADSCFFRRALSIIQLLDLRWSVRGDDRLSKRDGEN